MLGIRECGARHEDKQNYRIYCSSSHRFRVDLPHCHERNSP